MKFIHSFLKFTVDKRRCVPLLASNSIIDNYAYAEVNTSNFDLLFVAKIQRGAYHLVVSFSSLEYVSSFLAFVYFIYLLIQDILERLF